MLSLRVFDVVKTKHGLLSVGISDAVRFVALPSLLTAVEQLKLALTSFNAPLFGQTST